MKASVIYTPALFVLPAFVHAASTSCSQGITVIDGSISCSGTDCTIMCGGKSSKVVGQLFFSLAIDERSFRRRILIFMPPAPNDASCPGSVNAKCNGQQVSISGAQAAQGIQSSSAQALAGSSTGVGQATSIVIGIQANSTGGARASSTTGFQGISSWGIQATSTIGAPGGQITFPGGFIGFPDGS